MSWRGISRRTREFEATALVHMDALYRGALRLTRNHAQTEDLVQEALIRAFRSFNRFDAGTNCRAWLFKIMRNVFLNRVRSEREAPYDDSFFDDGARPLPETSHGTATPEEEFLQTVMHGDVDRALRGLPGRFREVVVLADIEGFTYREIAETLDCPIGTVMSRLSRGRGLLRQALESLARERGYARE